MPRLGLGLGLGSSASRAIGNIISSPFAPTDISGLDLWLDANEGVFNVAGNYFTEETPNTSYGTVLSGFPIIGELNINGLLYPRVGSVGYGFASFYTYRTIIGDKTITIGHDYFPGEEPFLNGHNAIYYITNTTDNIPLFYTTFFVEQDTSIEVYPWDKGPWYNYQDEVVNGSAVKEPRSGSELNVLATNNQTVFRWQNRAAGPNSSPQLQTAYQNFANVQPIFKSDVFGRKAVLFDGDAMRFDNVSNYSTPNYSYYIVSTSLLGSSTTLLHTAIRMGTSTTSSNIRSLFGANNQFLGMQNNTTSRISSFGRSVDNNAQVFSLRTNGASIAFGIGDGQDMWSNANTSAPNTAINSNTILIGSASTTAISRNINTNFSEILFFNRTLDFDEHYQIISYLKTKWNLPEL